ncbi:MAG: MoaD/ThiS family protein [Roseivivax sp.]|nr:MoaD/ThiS family protein [Roseivivax sp.]
MVAVHLWSSLTRFTDGARVVEVEAATVAEALKQLVETHPGLGPILDGGISVVIDGEMVPNRHTAIEPGAEVYLMQRLKGG